jgi:hypothetical protein
MGAEFNLVSYFVARYFGLAAYGSIYDWLYTPFMVGSSIGPGRVCQFTRVVLETCKISEPGVIALVA